MKGFLKKCLFLGSGLIYRSRSIFTQLRLNSGIQITIPFYHAVSDEHIPHLKYIIPYKNLAQFREDILFFSTNYSIIGIPELLDHLLDGHVLPPSPLLITFDDGLKEFYENAMPILEEYGATAALFINSGFMDNKKMFYRHKASLLVEKISTIHDGETLDRVRRCLGLNLHVKEKKIIESILNIDYLREGLLDQLSQILGMSFDEYLAEKRPYLTQRNVEEIIQKGFYIGAHSIDHPEYELLPVEQQVLQTINSVRSISEIFHLPYRIYAAPFQDADLSLEYFRETIGDHVDVSFGTDGILVDPIARNLQRFNMEGEQKYPANRMLAGYYLVMIILKLLRKQKLRRK